MNLRTVVSFFVCWLVVLGLGYHGALTGAAQLLWPSQANGRLLELNGKIVASEEMGQNFQSDKFFWPRPSATTPPYNPSGSSASNLSPSHSQLTERVAQRVAIITKEAPKALKSKEPEKIGVDWVTTSASGLDPHLSLASAQWQVARVAKARKMDPALVEELMFKANDAPTFWLIDQPGVNVVKLNWLLEQASLIPAHD